MARVLVGEMPTGIVGLVQCQLEDILWGQERRSAITNSEAGVLPLWYTERTAVKERFE